MQDNIGDSVQDSTSRPDPTVHRQIKNPDAPENNAQEEDDASMPQHITQEQAQDIPIDQDPDDPASP